MMNNSTYDTYSDAFKYKTSNTINAAAGLMEEELRMEAELIYKKNDIDTYFNLSMINSDLSQLSLMINFIYDIDMDNAFSPQFMTGLGVTDSTFNFNGNKYSSTQMALQVGAGIGIQLSDKLFFDLGFRHLKPMKGKFFDSDSSISLAGNSFISGFRYAF